MKIKIIEGKPADVVSRGFHRTDLWDNDAVVLISPGIDLVALAAALLDHVGVQLVAVQDEADRG